MGKCKNIECYNNTEDKKIYCSLSCRNYYVNKYIRNYSDVSKTLHNKGKKEYFLNPKICPKCKNKISYKKRRNTFCSKNCAFSDNNINRNGLKYNITEEGLKNLRKSACENLNGVDYKLSEIARLKYEKSPKNCLNCLEPLDYNNRNKRKFCSDICRRKYGRKDRDAYLNYKEDTKFKFNLADYPSEFDFSLIEKHGWYAPSNSRKPNISGVSRDHMLSVREGFQLDIEPKLLSHPANCRLMIHNENISKNKKSVLTKEELIDRINKWFIKYEKVTLA
jgi:hypothetical protein